MNYSDWSGLLITIGVIVLVYPITVIVLQFEILESWFRITLGIGSAMFGAGLGIGIGHHAYKEKNGGKDE